MAIGNAVQRGAFIFIYDEKGFKTGTAPAGTVFLGYDPLVPSPKSLSQRC